ncbi:polymorphic toxin-type HINT domain-containing protein [Nocardiopsis mangrovi]|uniref:Polymorphic toxin-type HINT domain-containing protein n=1 Tax=Nocardiopsis mangrovi TaxID=1179818 RepID=A0ABV9DVR5_9ACTN
MLRRIHDPERGANFVEYAAVILLVAVITSTVIGSGITGRVTGMIESAVDSVGAEGDGSGPQADGEEPTDTGSDDEGPDAEPADDGGDGPLDFMPAFDADLDPGNGAGGSFMPLGLDSLLPGPGSGGLVHTYSTGSFREDIAGLVDDAVQSQARATREGMEMAEETISGSIELYEDLREDAPGTIRRGLANGAVAVGEMHDEYASTMRDSFGLIRQGFNDGDYLGGLWDGASHMGLWNLTQATQFAISEEGFEHFANGDFEEGLIRSSANIGSWFVGGPALKGLSKLPTALGGRGSDGDGNGPDPDPEPNPDAQHLADGDSDGQGQDRSEEDSDRDGTSCPTGNSFVPGTAVLLANGTSVPIEDIAVGDEVLAFDPLTGEEGPREVTDTITGDGQKTLVTLTIATADGITDTVTATDEHPFWAPEQAQWVDAIDVEPGTWLRTSTGTWAQVTAVETDTAEDQRVHNLTIADLQTYYVLAGDSSLLVHNQNLCGADEWTTSGNLDRHYADHGDEMGYETQIEYSSAAIDLMCECDGARPGVLIKRDGDKAYYFDPESGEFGTRSSRGIITFFIPDDPQSYFDRQSGVLVNGES